MAGDNGLYLSMTHVILFYQLIISVRAVLPIEVYQKGYPLSPLLVTLAAHKYFDNGIPFYCKWTCGRRISPTQKQLVDQAVGNDKFLFLKADWESMYIGARPYGTFLDWLWTYVLVTPISTHQLHKM